MTESIIPSRIQGPPNPQNPTDLIMQEFELFAEQVKPASVNLSHLIDAYGAEPRVYTVKDTATSMMDILDIANALSTIEIED